MLAPRKVDRQAAAKKDGSAPPATKASSPPAVDKKQDSFHTRETRSGGRHIQDSTWSASGKLKLSQIYS